MSNINSQREIIARNGFAVSKTSGKSMRPLIWGGRHCVVVVPLGGTPRVGDILMFEQRLPDGARKPIVHRLVEEQTTKSGSPLFVMRGDNCLGCEYIGEEKIIGRVTEIHRVGGWRPWYIIPTKRIKVDGRLSRLYTRLWAALWPLRQLRIRIIGRLARELRLNH